MKIWALSALSIALMALPVSAAYGAVDISKPVTLSDHPIVSVNTISMNKEKEVSDVPVYSGSILAWDNGQGYAIFSAAYKQTRILIKNYSRKPVYYEISLNNSRKVKSGVLAGGKSTYQIVSTPFLTSSEAKWSVRAYTTDSSKRSVYVRAVGIQ